MFKFQNVLKVAVFTVLAASASAYADKPLVCQLPSSPINGGGGITIAEKGDTAMISGSFFGGEAHFVSIFGPYEAAKSIEGTATVYTFMDNLNQKQEITLIPFMIEGHEMLTAHYSAWSNAEMNCQ